jgi:putative addiction module component (TIGR02574 family)
MGARPPRFRPTQARYAGPVTSDAISVLREALALPDDDRASIAAELLNSLPEPPGAAVTDSDGWVAEIEGRARDVLAGTVDTEAWDDVERRVLDKLAGE